MLVVVLLQLQIFDVLHYSTAMAMRNGAVKNMKWDSSTFLISILNHVFSLGQICPSRARASCSLQTPRRTERWANVLSRNRLQLSAMMMSPSQYTLLIWLWVGLLHWFFINQPGQAFNFYSRTYPLYNDLTNFLHTNLTVKYMCHSQHKYTNKPTDFPSTFH